MQGCSMPDPTPNTNLPPPSTSVLPNTAPEIPALIPESVRRSAPANFILISTEEELILPADGGERNAQRLEAKRQALMKPLMDAGIPEQVVQKMSGRELLAAELTYVDPVTSKTLMKPEGAFDIKQLYDAESVLEFRFKPDLPDNAKAARTQFYEVLQMRMAEYGIRADIEPATHVNFSAWQQEGGKYTNLMDSQNPQFETRGARMVKEVVDLVRSSTQYVTVGDRQTQSPGDDIVAGTSRTNNIRQSGDGTSARAEVRLNGRASESLTTVNQLIDDIKAAGERVAASSPTQKEATVSIVQRGFFHSGTEDKLKLTRHVLNGSTIARDGRIIPDRDYIEQHGAKVAQELGILTPDSKPSFIPFGSNFNWEVDLVSQLMQNTRVEQVDGKPVVVFPEIRVNESLPLVLDKTTKQTDAKPQMGVRTVMEGGKPIIEVSRLLLETKEGRNIRGNGIEGVALANERLKQIGVDLSRSYSYAPARGNPAAWSVSGALESPKVRIDMTRLTAEQRRDVAEQISRVALSNSKTSGYQVSLDGEKFTTRDQMNSVEMLPQLGADNPIIEYSIDAEHFNMRMANADVIVLEGEEAYKAVHGKLVPQESLAAYTPDAPEVTRTTFSQVPDVFFTPEFAQTRALLEQISRYATQEPDAAKPGRTTFSLDKDTISTNKLGDVLATLRSDPEFKKLNPVVNETNGGIRIEIPRGVYEATSGRLDYSAFSRPLSTDAQTILGNTPNLYYSKAGNMTGIFGGVNMLINENAALPDSVRYFAAGTTLTSGTVGLGSDIVMGRAMTRANAAFAAGDMAAVEKAAQTVKTAQRVTQWGGGLASGVMLPVDIMQAADAFKKGDVLQGSLSTASATSDALILTSIVSNGSKVAAVAGPAGVVIAIGVTGADIGLKLHQIRSLVRDADQMNAAVAESEKNLFKPGVNENFVAYFDRNRALLTTRPYRAEMPSVNQYPNLASAVNTLVEAKALDATGALQAPPDKILTALDKQLAALQAERATLLQGFSDTRRSYSVGDPRFPNNTRTEPSDRELASQTNGPQLLKQRNAELGLRPIFAPSAYNDRDQQILALEAVNDKIKKFTSARMELVGDEKGLVAGKEGIQAYAPRFNTLAAFKKEAEGKALTIMAEMPEIEKTIAKTEARLAPMRESTGRLVAEFQKETGNTLDDLPIYTAKKNQVADMKKTLASDPSDKLLQVLTRKAESELLLLERDNLLSLQQQMSSRLVSIADNSASIANAKEVARKEAELGAPLQSPVLDSLKNDAMAKSKDYLEFKRSADAELPLMRQALNERFGDEPTQRKLLEVKDPAYMKAFEAIARREEAVTSKFIAAVAAESRFIKTRESMVDKAYEDKIYRETPIDLNIAYVETRADVAKRREPFMAFQPRIESSALRPAAREEKLDTDRIATLTFSAPAQQAERFLKELQQGGLMPIKAGATQEKDAAGNPVFVVQVMRNNLQAYLQKNNAPLLSDGALPLSMPSGKRIDVQQPELLADTPQAPAMPPKKRGPFVLEDRADDLRPPPDITVTPVKPNKPSISDLIPVKPETSVPSTVMIKIEDEKTPKARRSPLSLFRESAQQTGQRIAKASTATGAVISQATFDVDGDKSLDSKEAKNVQAAYDELKKMEASNPRAAEALKQIREVAKQNNLELAEAPVIKLPTFEVSGQMPPTPQDKGFKR